MVQDPKSVITLTLHSTNGYVRTYVNHIRTVVELIRIGSAFVQDWFGPEEIILVQDWYN